MKGLAAIARFRAGEFEPALEALAALDVAPAKVIALFPPAVAGRLASLQSEWIPLFGGPRPPPARADSGATEGSGPKRGEGEATKDEEKKEGVSDGQSRVRSGSVMLGGRTGSPMGSIRGSVRAGLDAIIPSLPSALRDDDTASIRSVQKEKMKGNLHVNPSRVYNADYIRRPCYPAINPVAHAIPNRPANEDLQCARCTSNHPGPSYEVCSVI